MSKFDITEAYIQALQTLQEQEKKDTVLKLGKEIKEVPVDKEKILVSPGLNREIQSGIEKRKRERTKQETKKLKENIDRPKDTYWEGKGKYQELVDLINDKLLSHTDNDAKISGIIPEDLFKQYVQLQNKYYRFYNDGELPFRKTSAGWNATKKRIRI